MEKIKRNSSKVVFLVVVALICFWAILGSAGDLNPPGPPGPTMKTLDEVEARTPIKASDLPLAISQSGSYYLAETINFSTQDTDGITITADNVTIDLNGYALIGPGTGSTGHGIHTGNSQITIKNGSISGWRGNGINLTGLSSQVFNLKVRNNSGTGINVGNNSIVIGCTSVMNEAIGISVGYKSIIKDCSSSSNHSRGFYLGNFCTISNCIARDNYAHGIYTGNDSVIENCVATENATGGGEGIRLDTGSVISNCTANNNGVIGIYGSGDNVISHCVAIENGESGIDARRSTVNNCTANDNGTCGIETQNCLVTSNTCIGNSSNLCLNSCTASNNHAP